MRDGSEAGRRGVWFPEGAVAGRGQWGPGKGEEDRMNKDMETHTTYTHKGVGVSPNIRLRGRMPK